MEPPDPSAPQDEQQSIAPASAAQIKSESLSGDALYLTTQTLAPSQSVGMSRPASSDSPQPLPSTETHDSAAAMPTASASKKKKGTATTKKAPKRARQGVSKKSAKKAKAEPQKNSATPAGSDEDGEDESDDESDHGPYCICRGPDDHRWMICCEKCEDWFHGECINLSKDIGESLIEKFICPNCTKGGFSTIYKKTCALKACRKPSRLVNNRQSVFCSNEHAATWWERMVGRLPKGKTKASLNDQLTQDEFMALLSSSLVGVGEDGVFRLATTPFTGKREDGSNEEDNLENILTEEEKSFLENALKTRTQMAEETILCEQMLDLIDLAQNRRRSLIADGRFNDDICGYDYRLDTISARDAFAAFAQSPEGEAIFSNKVMGDPAEGTSGSGMCERKRCKVHYGWNKILALGIRYHMKELSAQAGELSEEESIVREAAGERWRRKKAEHNWVEVIEA